MILRIGTQCGSGCLELRGAPESPREYRVIGTHANFGSGLVGTIPLHGRGSGRPNAGGKCPQVHVGIEGVRSLRSQPPRGTTPTSRVAWWGLEVSWLMGLACVFSHPVYHGDGAGGWRSRRPRVSASSCRCPAAKQRRLAGLASKGLGSLASCTTLVAHWFGVRPACSLWVPLAPLRGQSRSGDFG